MLAVREEATRSKGEGGERRRAGRAGEGKARYSGEHCCQR